MKRELEVRIKSLHTLMKKQHQYVHEITLPFVSLGDLRAR